MGLTKSKSELLGSRLKELNLLQIDVKITSQRNRSADFAKYFEQAGELVYCKDIEGLMQFLEIPLEFECWRLFIDSSKQSLKGVLLHNGSEYPSLPIAYSTITQESYEIIANLLQKLQYNKYQWDICADLKIVGIISGLKGGYASYMCFLCKWNTRQTDTHCHYYVKEFPVRTEHIIDNYSVIHPPLVPSHRIILPPLHIKLGIVKNFIKRVYAINSSAAERLKILFPKLTESKIKEGNTQKYFVPILFMNKFYASLNLIFTFSRNIGWT